MKIIGKTALSDDFLSIISDLLSAKIKSRFFKRLFFYRT